MPTPQRRARAPRCQVYENNRRCTRDGHGNPAVCARHRAAIANTAPVSQPFATIVADEIGNFLKGKPINREAIFGGLAESFGQQWAAGIGGDYRPDVGRGETENSAHRRAQAGGGMGVNWDDLFNEVKRRVDESVRNTGQPPPTDWQRGQRRTPQEDEGARIAREVAAARQVMGFAASEPLTEEVIAARKRLLAKKHHPDRGGSAEKMAAINNAADVLMAAL